MITDGPFRLAGLKENDITSEIDKIIYGAVDIIVICGYSFTNPKNPKSVLHKIISSSAKSKHCILPIRLFKSSDANRDIAKYLVEHGVSVSLESNNHSKWIMNESELYFGSANFSMGSLERRIEVVAFRPFLVNDPIFQEFKLFTLSSIKRMYSHSDKRKLWGVIGKNQNLISNARQSIKKFNPSIQKVISTLNGIDFVRQVIYQIVENNYWYVSDMFYLDLVEEANHLLRITHRINAKGWNLLNATYKGLEEFSLENYDSEFSDLEFISQGFRDSLKDYPSNTDQNATNRLIFRYNQECGKFYSTSDAFVSFSMGYLTSMDVIPEWTSKNRKLGRILLSRFNNN